MKFVKYECMLVNHMDVYNIIGEWSTMVTNPCQLYVQVHIHLPLGVKSQIVDLDSQMFKEPPQLNITTNFKCERTLRMQSFSFFLTFAEGGRNFNWVLQLYVVVSYRCRLQHYNTTTFFFQATCIAFVKDGIATKYCLMIIFNFKASCCSLYVVCSQKE